MSDSLRLVTSMRQALRRFLPNERITRVRNFSMLVTSLYKARSVHLAHLVRHWPVPGRLSSLTNRLRRFLSNKRVEPQAYYRPIAAMLLRRFAGAPIRLLVDVTSLGKSHRMLTVSIAYRKRALPLAWSVHAGSNIGNVSAEAVIALLEPLRDLIPSQSSVCLLGDSGFGQALLVRYLQQQAWDFVLRLRGRYWVKPEQGSWRYVSTYAPEPGQTHFVGAVRYTKAYQLRAVYLLAHHAEHEDEPWYLLSSQPVRWATLRLYKVRMWTEELYGDLKGHGFDLEATQLRRTDRLSRLVLAVFYAYVWLIALASVVVKRGLRRLVDRRSRRDKSYFRIGWDYLAHRIRMGKPIPVYFQPAR